MKKVTAFLLIPFVSLKKLNIELRIKIPIGSYKRRQKTSLSHTRDEAIIVTYQGITYKFPEGETDVK